METKSKPRRSEKTILEEYTKPRREMRAERGFERSYG
jgi:hypothetical protein